jgi:hypothetical protein
MLKEEIRLKLCEKSLLTAIIGPKEDKMIQLWRELRCFSSYNIIIVGLFK